MRPLELVLVAADVAAFLALTAPLIGRSARLRRVAPIALVAAAAQLAVEGARWQLVPAYALAFLFAGISLARGPARAGTRPGRRWSAVVAAALGLLALATAALLPLAFPVFRFPRPGGPFGIGTTTYHWIDADRAEAFVADPAQRRELMVQLWYPAVVDASSPRAPYVADAAVLAPLARLLRLPAFVLGHLSRITTNAVESAPMAGVEARYPVLIFSHGRAGYRQHDTWVVEELVSRGYVVAAIDHPYAAAGVVFPDGRLAAFDARMLDRAFEDRIVPYIAEDVVFTVDRLRALDAGDPKGILTGRLDLEHVGAFGVSLGGQIAAEACRREPRLRACLALDVWAPPDVAQAGLRQPSMWMSRDAATMRLEGWAPVYVDRTLGTIRAAFDRATADAYIVLVPGMFHVDFSDAPLLSPLTSSVGITGSIDPRRSHEIVAAYSLAFFDRYLRDRPAVLLEGAARPYPEVIFEARRP